MLGVRRPVRSTGLDLDYVAVKAPMFSFSRLVGADPMLGVEMASTGEVGCFGDDIHEALLHALLATGFRVPNKGVLLSLGPLQDKYWFADEARVIHEELKLPIFATPGTAEALQSLNIPCTSLGKGPADGFTSYTAFVGSPPRTRWGDYGAAVTDGNTIWLASEYIAQTCNLDQYLTSPLGSCGKTRTALANWATQLTKLTP